MEFICTECICFYINWDKEVQDTMKAAPGEKCSNSMDTHAAYEKGSCPCYQNAAE